MKKKNWNKIKTIPQKKQQLRGDHTGNIQSNKENKKKNKEKEKGTICKKKTNLLSSDLITRGR